MTPTPQEKATALVARFILAQNDYRYNTTFTYTKNCALICVDEILAIKKEIWDDFHREYFDYWQQVKNEIEKL